MFFLRSNMGMVVPSTTCVNIPADTSVYVKRVAGQFCEWFGGATVSEDYGYYVTDDKQLVSEPVFIVWSYCTTEQLSQYSTQVIALAQGLCVELQQESIAVIINNAMCFVTAE